MTAILGGLFVVLPLAVLIFVFIWFYGIITSILQPVTDFMLIYLPLPEMAANLIGIAGTILFFFLMGVLIKTQVGSSIVQEIEGRVLKFLPGYEMIKEIALQFSGKKQMPFSRVALIDLYGDSQLVTGFITDDHGPKGYTVFVPTSPMPTSGIIYHLPRHMVHPIEVPAEEAMRSIISCGVGSHKLIESYKSMPSGNNEG